MSAASNAQTSSTPGAGLSSSSLQDSSSLTDDDDDDDGATTSLSEDASDLVCDLSQPGGPVSTPQTQSDTEDHPPSALQLEKAAEKGVGWVNSRRRKSARPQWHYEGTVLDKSQRVAVNGTDDEPAATAWDADHGHDERHRTADNTSADDNDNVRSEANALSHSVTSH